VEFIIHVGTRRDKIGKEEFPVNLVVVGQDADRLGISSLARGSRDQAECRLVPAGPI
jgi:hypothetical protein